MPDGFAILLPADFRPCFRDGFRMIRDKPVVLKCDRDDRRSSSIIVVNSPQAPSYLMNLLPIDPSFSEYLDHSDEPHEPLPKTVKSATSGDHHVPVLTQVEVLIRAVLGKPAPSSTGSDPDWARLFRFCEKHRHVLADCLRSRKKTDLPGYLDLWLRQLASPPRGEWSGARLGLMPFIRVAGIPPRSDDDPMFTLPSGDGA